MTALPAQQVGQRSCLASYGRYSKQHGVGLGTQGRAGVTGQRMLNQLQVLSAPKKPSDILLSLQSAQDWSYLPLSLVKATASSRVTASLELS